MLSSVRSCSTSAPVGAFQCGLSWRRTAAASDACTAGPALAAGGAVETLLVSPSLMPVSRPLRRPVGRGAGLDCGLAGAGLAAAAGLGCAGAGLGDSGFGTGRSIALGAGGWGT